MLAGDYELFTSYSHRLYPLFRIWRHFRIQLNSVLAALTLPVCTALRGQPAPCIQAPKFAGTLAGALLGPGGLAKRQPECRVLFSLLPLTKAKSVIVRTYVPWSLVYSYSYSDALPDSVTPHIASALRDRSEA